MPIFNPDPLNARPYIIPPSAGDLEEARVKRAIDQAQLYKLQQEPNQEQQRIALARAGLEELTNYHQGQLRSETRGQDVTQRGQDVTLRGQDLDVRNEDTKNKNAVFTSLLHDFAGRLDVTPAQLGGIASQFGHPEAAAALGGDVEAARQKKAQVLLVTYGTLKDKERPAFLAELQKNDPETHKMILAHLGTLADHPTAEEGQGSAGTRFGETARGLINVLNDPTILPRKGIQAGRNFVRDNAGEADDFFSALLGKKKY